jgi:glycosyltransferase involved in cell wall biosynthesis
MVLGPRDTGVGIWTRGLLKALPRADRDSRYVVYHRREAGSLTAEPGENVRFLCAALPSGSRLGRIAWEQLVLPAHARRDRLDVLHCPAYVMPRWSGAPAVVTLHDLFVYTHPGLCKRLNVLHYRLMLPATIRRAALLHCTSHWTRGILCALLPWAAERARVIHPAVDDAFGPQDPQAVEDFLRRQGLQERPFLFVGNIEPKKNVVALLEAMALLREEYGSQRKLVMVGAEGWGWRRPEEKIHELGLQDRIVRLGYVPRQELPLVYASALALVFPSVVEGFGLPPLEAMACGTPVITSGAGGLAESVGAAALLVREPNPDFLAEAMYQIEASEDLRRRLSEAGLFRARSFRWDGAAKQFLELYREAAGGRLEERRPVDTGPPR